MLRENQARKCEEAMREICVPGDLISSSFLRELLNTDIRNASAYLSAQEKKGRLKLIGKMPNAPAEGRGKKHVYVYEVQDLFFEKPVFMRGTRLEAHYKAGGTVGRSWEAKDLPILNIKGAGL